MTRARTWIRLVLLVLACALVVMGALRRHRVYDQEDPFAAAFAGMATFRSISDFALTIDATFSGTVRKDGKLFSTYDRARPRGKKACPT